MFTPHYSTPHRNHILSRKGGKNGKCLHNIFLLHLDFIFWTGRMAKTANAYKTCLLHMDFIFWRGRLAKTANINSTPHGFHTLSRKDGNSGESLQNIFLLHMDLIIWTGWQKRRMFTQHFLLYMNFICGTGRVAKTANAYTTYFYSVWISYFEQEGWQKRRMFRQDISIPHEFHILNRKGGKDGKYFQNILLNINIIFGNDGWTNC